MTKDDKFPVIFAFGHQSRMGKDFCAQTIIKKYRNKYKIKLYKFADILKNIAYGLCLTPHPPIYYESLPGMNCRKIVPPGFNRSPVDTWITLGPILRAYDPDIFVRPICQRIEKDKPDIALITDLRFPNEIDGLDHIQGWLCLIKVVCPEIEPLDSEADHALDNYPDWDHIISAHKGALDDLKNQILTIVKEELEP